MPSVVWDGHCDIISIRSVDHVGNIFCGHTIFSQTSNISHTFVDNVIIDHLDVVGASPVGAAPTTSSFLI